MATGTKTKKAPASAKAHSKYRSIDGVSNNLPNPRWGAAGEQLLRLGPAEYTDGLSEPAGAGRPHPREISNAICAQTGSVLDPSGLSDYVWAWGQFLDHELDLTGEADPVERLDMTVPPSDSAFAGRKIPFTRSAFDPATGGSNPRQQVNHITSYIDASNVYGSDNTRAHALRTHNGGKLRADPGPGGLLLPKNLGGLPNAGGTFSHFFLAGDIRSNEHVVLTSMHTLFVREHNRLCDEIHGQHPGLKDEELYQQARKIVGALMQAITYNEFLPALLGKRAIASYKGYDEAVNAGITNEFSTACYRVGHSMLSAQIPVGNGTGLPLREGFFRPDKVDQMGIEPFLLGLAHNTMQRIDTRIVDEVRNFLFRHATESSGEMLDLAALNIQRGRDHGISSYNACRAAVGLPAKATMAQISSDTAVRNALQNTYGATANIDAWVGGLAEGHARGAAVGELIGKVLTEQFQRTRDGDWYWYENDPELSKKEQRDLSKTTLADVIKRNTAITSLQKNVFFAA